MLREQYHLGDAPGSVRHLAGTVYTQTTDVEIEMNGYLTYDRAVEKMDAARIGETHRALCRALEGS